MESKKMNNLETGTTTMGIVCKDGLVLAADNKATAGHLIVTKDTRKIYQIIDKTAMTIAGSVGDAQAMVRLLKAEMKLYKFNENDTTVKATATLLANVLRSSYKSFMPEMVQLILGGCDINGSHVYSVDAAGGVSKEKDYAFSGSGSVIAVGVLEGDYKKDMSLDEGVELAKKALTAAKERDVFSGGIGFDILKITKDKFEWIKV